MRSPAYGSFNIDPDDELLNGRFLPCQDQGEHEMSYRVVVGTSFRESKIHKAVATLNALPIWQVYYPQPTKSEPCRRSDLAETISVDDRDVHVVGVKRADKGNAMVIRLQNTSTNPREVRVRVKPFREAICLSVARYGLATLKVQKGGTRLQWQEVNLVELEGVG